MLPEHTQARPVTKLRHVIKQTKQDPVIEVRACGSFKTLTAALRQTASPNRIEVCPV